MVRSDYPPCFLRSGVRLIIGFLACVVRMTILEMFVEMLMLLAQPVTTGGCDLAMRCTEIRLVCALGVDGTTRDQLVQVRRAASRAFGCRGCG
jgi:hypothetical protein